MYVDAIDTVTSLLDATIDAIGDVGYTGATTEEIARRAGVTQGAIFHHFATRKELIAAALRHHDELSQQRYRRVGEAAMDGDLSDLVAGLLAMARTVPPAVWIEVLVATRTEPGFLPDVSAALWRNIATVRTILGRHPALEALTPAAREHWFDLLASFYFGEVTSSMGGEGDALDAETVAAFAALAEGLPHVERRA